MLLHVQALKEGYEVFNNETHSKKSKDLQYGPEFSVFDTPRLFTDHDQDRLAYDLGGIFLKHVPTYLPRKFRLYWLRIYQVVPS